jgi:H+/gluconate symporter-like permease
VRTQIWIAVSVYVLIAILKKRLKLGASLSQILQTLSVTLFEKMPLDQLLANMQASDEKCGDVNQLKLQLD